MGMQSFKNKNEVEKGEISKGRLLVLGVFLGTIPFFGYHTYSKNNPDNRIYVANATTTQQEIASTTSPQIQVQVLDKDLYNKKMLELANYPAPKVASSTGTSTPVVRQISTSTRLWPAKAPYPNAGAILPFNRIVAYYGNFYSRQMGALGEYDPPVMLAKLQEEVKKWEVVDPNTPVVPAIHYIASVAQASPGKDGMYRFRMPDEHIQKARTLAKEVNGIVFLDLQIGHSSVVSEVNAIKEYLKHPEVHLGLDPEFAMREGKKPGVYIGVMDASEINQAIEILSSIVRENSLPPKILIVHRFTEKMVTNATTIRPTPEVQVVMNMDGWGQPSLKLGTHKAVIVPEPVQFTGFKLFYKNDLRAPSTRLLTPKELLELSPRPSYIQYQ